MKDDDLQICDPGDYLCSEQMEGEKEDDLDSRRQSSPISTDSDSAADESGEKAETTKGGGSSIAKLSDEQVDNIRSNLLNGDSEYVSAQDASSIIHDLSHYSEGPTLQRREKEKPREVVDEAADLPPGPAASSPEASPSDTDLPTPKTAPMRKVAYFHKNFIQLTGAIRPTAGEEMVIDDRHYILKQKKIKPQYTIAMFAVVVVLLLFAIGKQFVSPTLPGNGSIIGVILDDTGRPLTDGAKIALPESGKKTTSNPIGFFRFDNVPTGVYVVSYTLPNGKVGNESISVAKDEITLLSLSSDKAENPVASRSSNDRRQSSTNSRRGAQANNMPPIPDEKKQGSNQSTSSQKAYSEIQLEANVDGAKLIINGEVLGSGNMTYKKLAPGDHKAQVTKTGYKAWSGKIHLDPNETFVLAVNLEKAGTESAAETQGTTYTADDFYQSGKTMLAGGNIDAAIQDFSEAINMKPSLADAYLGRAEAYQVGGYNDPAEADYTRAGEIYATQKRNQSAMSCFNKALELNGGSVPALINRGDLYLRADNKDKAMDDFRRALDQDKDNFRANFELGKMYFGAAKYKDADKMLRRACEANPQNPEVYHYLMLNYFARDDFGKVKKTYGDFKDNVSSDQQQAFLKNPRFDAILRIVGEYERP